MAEGTTSPRAGRLELLCHVGGTGRGTHTPCHAAAKAIQSPCAIPVTQSEHPVPWHGRGSTGISITQPGTVHAIM